MVSRSGSLVKFCWFRASNFVKRNPIRFIFSCGREKFIDNVRDIQA